MPGRWSAPARAGRGNGETNMKDQCIGRMIGAYEELSKAQAAGLRNAAVKPLEPSQPSRMDEARRELCNAIANAEAIITAYTIKLSSVLDDPTTQAHAEEPTPPETTRLDHLLLAVAGRINNLHARLKEIHERIIL